MEHLDTIFAFCKKATETDFAGCTVDLDDVVTLEVWCSTTITKESSRSGISGYVTAKVDNADIVVRSPLPEMVLGTHPPTQFAQIMQYVGDAYKIGWSIRGASLKIVPSSV